MNTYVIMSYTEKTGEQELVGVNVNIGAAQNAALHAVENYCRFTGTAGAVEHDGDMMEFWPESDPDAYRVKICVAKFYLNFTAAR